MGLGDRNARVNASPATIECPDGIGIDQLCHSERDCVWQAERSMPGFQICSVVCKARADGYS